MFVAEKSIAFEAGHRLMNYDGKCKWLHGHNYIITLGIQSEELDDRGMIEDFGTIKKLVKTFIDDKLDHGTILCVKDEEWIKSLRDKKQKVYVIEENPTAEALAKHFYYIFKDDFPLMYVTIEETPTSKATFTP